MKAFVSACTLASIMMSGVCIADELSTAKAEELLKPVMATDCGSYYTTQGNPTFADIEGKQICSYKPTVTRIINKGDEAIAEYTHDRVFDNNLSVAWLNDYTKLQSPSMMFKKLKSNLDGWRASGGVDKGYRPAKATFKLSGGNWMVVTAP
ncbi:hypothetical protein [Stenotrophobium rhamnosiphilum]|uniref:hypothetical protein n=1 Tax=Stenotrophobium rhamnosiphilum TaxID=2029166 RepID=UPI0011B292AD|nr:hypothetical protein [Stenotrophobium rhamnosiphilum]